MKEKILEYLRSKYDENYNKFIEKSIKEDGYFNPADSFGGNFDDTFYGGQEHGYQQALDEIINFIETL